MIEALANFSDEDRQHYLRNLMNDAALEKAEAKGLEVVYPDEFTLTLDLDIPYRPELSAELMTMLHMVNEYYEVTLDKITRSEHGNTHVYLKTAKPLSQLEQITLQAILGSDPKRELFSFIRAKEKLGGWSSLMFEKPGEGAAPKSVIPQKMEYPF